MTVQFTIWDYWQTLLLGILGPLAVYLLISLLLMRFLRKKHALRWFAILSLPVFLVWLLTSVHYLIPAMERTECLYPPERAYTHTTAGTVTNLRPADHIPLYYYDGEFRGGLLVTIDGTAYYSIDHPLLAEGTSLHFTYCPDQNLLMAFSPIETGEVAALQAPFVMPQPAEPEPIPARQLLAGEILNGVGLAGFALLVLLQNPIHHRLAIWLQDRDRRHRGPVRPNYTALVRLGASLFFMGLVISGGCLQNPEPALLLLFGISALGMLFYTWLRCRTVVWLEGRTLWLRQYRKEYAYHLSDLRAVYWTGSALRKEPRTLCITIGGTTIKLNQEEKWGLEELHRKLSQILELQSNRR